MLSLTNAIVECGKSIESQQKKSVVFLTWWKSEVLVKAAENMEHTEEKLVEFKEKVGDMIGDAGEKVKEMKEETKEKMGDILEKMPCYYLHKREEDNEEEEEENSSEKDNSWMQDERYEVHTRSPQHGQQVLHICRHPSRPLTSQLFSQKRCYNRTCVYRPGRGQRQGICESNLHRPLGLFEMAN